MCLPSGLDGHLPELVDGLTDGRPALSDLDIPPPHFLPQKIHIGSHFTVPIAIPPRIISFVSKISALSAKLIFLFTT